MRGNCYLFMGQVSIRSNHKCDWNANSVVKDKSVVKHAIDDILGMPSRIVSYYYRNISKIIFYSYQFVVVYQKIIVMISILKSTSKVFISKLEGMFVIFTIR